MLGLQPLFRPAAMVVEEFSLLADIISGLIDGDRITITLIRLDGYAIVPRDEYEELLLLSEKCQK